MSAADRRGSDLETRWRQVLEVGQEAYVALSDDGCVTDANRAAQRLLGDDLRGTDLAGRLDAGERDGFRAELEEAARHQPESGSTSVLVRLRRPTGGSFLAECLVWGVDRRGGRTVHCFLRDVTARREAEQATALLAAVVEGSPDAVVTESPDGRVLTWNPAAEAMFGWSAEEALGGPALLVVPVPDAGAHLAQVAAVFRGELPPPLETERVTRGGTLVPVSVRSSPVRDGSGQVVAVTTTARDTTEQRWMSETLDSTLQQLQGALTEAQSSEESSRRFLADAAHQLRTPLAGLRACAELLLLGSSPEDSDRLLATIVRETARAARLITGLLRIARLDQGLALPPGSVDLGALCRDEAERLSLLSPDLDVLVHLDDDPPGPLPLDGASVQEVVSNLGDNARRHARSRVVFSVTTRGGQVHVRVDDDGPGVPPALREQVFERFVSLDEHGGSGLGLPIARGLARALRGDLVYDDGFVLLLPAAVPAVRAGS